MFLPALLQTRLATPAPTPTLIPEPTASDLPKLPSPHDLCTSNDLCPAFRRLLFNRGVLRQPKSPTLVHVLTLHESQGTVVPEYVSFAREVNRAFAAKRGYRFTAFNASLARDRHPAWSKVIAIQRAFADGAEYALWLDSDAFLPRADFRVESLIERLEQDAVFSLDPPLWNCSMVCSGVFAMRRSNWTTSFLEQWWAAGDTVQGGVLRHWHPYEQGVLNALIDEDSDKLSAHVVVLPYCVLNSVCSTNQHGPHYASPIMHCMSLNSTEKLAFMTTYVDGFGAASATPLPTAPPVPPTVRPLSCGELTLDAGAVGTRRWCSCCMSCGPLRSDCVARGYLSTECLIGFYAKKRAQVDADELSLDDKALAEARHSECVESCERSFGFVGSATWCRCCALDCFGHRQSCRAQNGFCVSRCTSDPICSHRSFRPVQPQQLEVVRERQETITAIGPYVVAAPATPQRIVDEFLERGASVMRCCDNVTTVPALLRIIAFADVLIGMPAVTLTLAVFMRPGTIVHELVAGAANTTNRALPLLAAALNQTFVVTSLVEPLTDVHVRAIVDHTMQIWLPTE